MLPDRGAAPGLRVPARVVVHGGNGGQSDRCRPRTVLTVVWLVIVAAVVGALIGAVGVGGVLLVPALVISGALGAHGATATSSWAFLFTGVVGTYRYGRRGVVPWPLVVRLCLGAVPAALLGVWVNQLLPGALVVLALGAVTMAAGVHALRPVPQRQPVPLGTATTLSTGAVVGFGSALTGTGGPVLLVPVLLALGAAPLLAVAAGQAIQLPVVGVASAGYLAAGDVHLGLGTALGLAAAAGVLVGEAAARRAAPDQLRRAVALACIGAGLLLVLRIAVTAVT
jgi:uncharacterized protein